MKHENSQIHLRTHLLCHICQWCNDACDIKNEKILHEFHWREIGRGCVAKKCRFHPRCWEFSARRRCLSGLVLLKQRTKNNLHQCSKYTKSNLLAYHSTFRLLSMCVRIVYYPHMITLYAVTPDLGADVVL